MPALVTMLLFVFFLVIAIALTVWSALMLGSREGAGGRMLDSDEDFVPVVLPPRQTNDEVRGARASVQPSNRNDDAFERFLHAERKD